MHMIDLQTFDPDRLAVKPPAAKKNKKDEEASLLCIIKYADGPLCMKSDTPFKATVFMNEKANTKKPPSIKLEISEDVEGESDFVRVSMLTDDFVKK